MLCVDAIHAIVPTYERPGLLRDCVQSLLRQTRPLAAIVVVDDGSSVDIGDALAGLDGPIQLIRQENRGKAAALNLGLKSVESGYVWVCDDDDLALPDAAERLGAALDADPAAGFAYGGFLRFRDHAPSGRRKVFDAGYWPSAAETEDTFGALLDDFFMFQFATLTRRSAYAAVGPFREDLLRSQDYEMALRLARRFGGRRVEGPVFLQRQHDLARGAQRDRFDAGQAFAKWVDYDQKIFRELREALPLEAYVPRAMGECPRLVRVRGALLKRGCVFARRKLWPEAFEDISRAARLARRSDPHAAECEIGGRILGGKYGCLDLLRDGGLLDRFLAALGSTAYGMTLRRRAARSLRWRVRKALTAGRFGEAAAYLTAIRRLTLEARPSPAPPAAARPHAGPRASLRSNAMGAP